MDLAVLDGMASGTAGTAVDTEELSIAVQGALISGNTAEIILRVTAKKLDSVLYDNGIETLNNYRFGDESAMLPGFERDPLPAADACNFRRPDRIDFFRFQL